MQTLNQKFNSLVHRHPWALQAGIAGLIVVVALTATFIGGTTVRAVGPLDVQHPQISPAEVLPNHQPYAIEWSMDMTGVNRTSETATVTYSLQSNTNNPNPPIVIGEDTIEWGVEINPHYTHIWTPNFAPDQIPSGDLQITILYTVTSLGPRQGMVFIGHSGFFTVIQSVIPDITGINPTSGPVGTQVTLTGTNFGDGQDLDIGMGVLFSEGPGGGDIEIVSWSNTEIVAIVPSWASDGVHTIQVALNGPIYSNSLEFTVTHNVTLASATYYSQPLTEGLVVNGIGPVNFQKLFAVFNQDATGSDVSIAVGFFNDNGAVYSSSDDTAIDSEGYYIIPSSREGELMTDGFVLPTSLNTKANQVRFIRFRIYMQSADITAVAQPWVSSVALMFTASDGNTIGLINFVDEPVAGKVVKTITRGGTGTFQIRITPANFIGSAILNVGPVTKVGDIANTPVTTIVPTFATNPVDLANGVVDINLQFTVSNDPTLSGVYQFDIFGHDTTNENAILTPAVGIGQIDIADSNDVITLTLTIPVEGGKPADTTKAHPRFTIRLYNGLTKTLEKTALETNAQNQVSVVATHTELPAGTYTAYARSDRHLWGKSTQTNLVVTDTTTAASLTFPTLLAGNLNEDNKINAVDLPPSTEYGVANLWSLGDLNNDGKINVMDIMFIMNLHYSLWGDQLPDETR